MKILHIIPDDKFWLSPVQIFSSLPCENEYVCIVDRGFESFHYIESDIIIPYRKDTCSELWHREDVDAYMFHSLPPFLYNMILEIPHNKVVIISSWGYDVYCNLYGITPIYPYKLYMRLTNAYVNRVDVFTPMRYLYHLLKWLVPSNNRIQRDRVEKLKLYKESQNAVIERTDYWATVLPLEYELLSKIKGFKAKYFPFQYSLKETAKSNELIDVQDADRILIGNSADPTNNHLDVLSVLKKRNISNQLYLPMAYGNQEYADMIEERIKKKKINAVVQRQFVPYNDYLSLIRKCRVGVFGHLRQQAIGNINACLLQGSKVFLYKDSISYRYYKSAGYIVYSIDEDLSQESVNEPLTEEQIQTNINKLSFFSFETVLNKVKEALQDIQQLV